MKYDFDSYLLYEVTSSSLYTAKVVVELNIPVHGEVLREAAQKAFRRFPYYSRTVRRDDQGAFVLEPCEKPICVFEEGDQVTLGTEQTNGLLFAITYGPSTVYFNFCHNFCGGCGAMMWIKSTLWQYLTDEGYEVDSEGILTPGSPIPPEETAVPDPESFPEEEVIGRYTGGDSYVPIKDYLPYLTNPSKGGQVFYPITIDKSALMKFARENDGSPNSILSAAMFRMCSRVFPKAKQISSGIVCNYRKDVGCPETYRDLVRVIHARYMPTMKDWPIEKLSTVTRGSMYLQMQPEISRETYRKVAAYREKIDNAEDRLRAEEQSAAQRSKGYLQCQLCRQCGLGRIGCLHRRDLQSDGRTSHARSQLSERKILYRFPGPEPRQEFHPGICQGTGGRRHSL